jgi:hypothetical protein
VTDVAQLAKGSLGAVAKVELLLNPCLSRACLRLRLRPEERSTDRLLFLLGIQGWSTIQKKKQLLSLCLEITKEPTPSGLLGEDLAG